MLVLKFYGNLDSYPLLQKVAITKGRYSKGSLSLKAIIAKGHYCEEPLSQQFTIGRCSKGLLSYKTHHYHKVLLK